MIVIRADRANAKTVSTQLLTSGMVGARVKFVFSHEWDDLLKTAVFKAGDASIVVVDSQWDGNICTIPNECLAVPGKMITVGVYGCNDAGDLVIPTVFAKVGRVRVGADPNGDESAKSSLPVYEQIRSSIGNLSDLDTADKSNLVSAINEALRTGGSGGGTTANAVTYTEQALTDAQKQQARTNIGAGTSDFSGNYNDLTDKPATLPNPNAITFTGAATGTYDGSEAVTINIPKVGSNNLFIVTVTSNGDGTYASDKTNVEIKEAVEAGAIVRCYYCGSGYYELWHVYNNTAYFLIEDTYVNGYDDKKHEHTHFLSLVLISENGVKLYAHQLKFIDAEGIDASYAKKNLDIVKASVGQVLRVKAVDDSGAPIEWEAADATGGTSGPTNAIEF